MADEVKPPQNRVSPPRPPRPAELSEDITELVEPLSEPPPPIKPPPRKRPDGGDAQLRNVELTQAQPRAPLPPRQSVPQNTPHPEAVAERSPSVPEVEGAPAPRVAQVEAAAAEAIQSAEQGSTGAISAENQSALIVGAASAYQSEPQRVAAQSVVAAPHEPRPAERSAPAPIAAPSTSKTEAAQKIEALPPQGSELSSAQPLSVWQRQARAEIKLLEERIEQEENERRRGRLHYEIARLYEHPLGELSLAERHDGKAVEANPKSSLILAAARRTALLQGSHAQALKLFDAEINLAPSAQRKGQLLYQKAQLLEEALGQRKEAREAYKQAIAVDAQEPSALFALERLALLDSDFASQNKHLEAQILAQNTDLPLRAARLEARARLLDIREKKRGDSVELYHEALRALPHSTIALQALKRLLYAQGRWADLSQVLKQEAEVAAEPSVRAMGWYRVALIERDKLGDTGRAIFALERALLEAPADMLLLEQLASAYEQASRHQEHLEILERLVPFASSKAARVVALQQIAELALTRLKDEGQAQSWYQRALKEDPTFAPVLASLGQIYTRKKDWDKLIAMHLSEAEATHQNSSRAQAHARVAEVYEIQCANLSEAERHYARALALDPKHAGAFKALARLFTQERKHRELVELYERGIEQTADALTRIEYLFRIGRIQEDELAAPGHAVSVYKRILELDPKHLGALHAWQRSAERAGRFKELALGLETEAQRTTDKAQVVPLLHRAGEVYEYHVRDDAAALERFQKVLELDKKFAPNLSSLGRIYYRLGRFKELAEIYELELQNTPKGASSAAILYKLGELNQAHTGRVDEAIKYYRKALEQDALHSPSLLALERYYSAERNWPELVKVLQLKLSATQNNEARARVALYMGEVYENQLADLERALAAYDMALAAEPTLRPALDGRVRLLAESGQNKRLVEELEREAKASQDAWLAVGTWISAAEIYRDVLNEPARAVQCYEAALERNPEHVPSLLALSHLYEKLGSWDKLAVAHAHLAQHLNHTGSRVAVLRELARLQRSKQVAGDLRHTAVSILHLDSKDALALEWLEHAAIQAQDPALLDQVDARLAAILEDPSLASAYRTRLAEAKEQAGDGAALEAYRAALEADIDNYRAAKGFARVAERRADRALLREAAEYELNVAQDLERAAALLVQSAKLERSVGNLGAALGDLKHALEFHPDHAEAAELLYELSIAAGQVDELHAALMTAANASKLRLRHASLWAMVADLLANQKRDLPAALAALNRVLTDDPNNPETLVKLAELYAQDGQWAEAVDRLGRAIQQKPEDPLLSRAQVLHASILSERLGDDTRALVSVEAALKREPDNRAALITLIGIQRRRRDIQSAHQSAKQLVAVSGNKVERNEAYQLIAELELERGQPEAAAQALVEAVGLSGLSALPALSQVVAKLSEASRPAILQKQVDALMRYRTSAEASEEDKIRIELTIASVLDQGLGQRDRALAGLQAAVVASPGHAELRYTLAKQLSAAGHHAQAAEELRKLLTVDVEGAVYWRELAGELEAMGRVRERNLALAPLIVLGAANDLERATLDANPPHPASATAGAFDAVAYRGVDAAAGGGRGIEVLWHLGESLGKIYPLELSRYGVSSRDRLSARSSDPLRLLADRVARVFGVESFDLYVHRAHAGSVEVEFGDPPVLLVPAHVSTLAESQQVFLFARIFASVRRGIYAVDKLTPQQVSELLSATIRGFVPGFGGADAELDALSRRVQKTLSRRGKKALEEMAGLYANEPVSQVDEWCRRLRLSSARAALVVADDLPGTVQLLRRTEGDLAGVRGAALAQGMALIDDLMRFWVSDSAFTLRRHIGMT